MKPLNLRWTLANVLILDNTIVGSICQTASGDWEAFGCMNDWQDTDLETHNTEQEARKAVESWVRENA